MFSSILVPIDLADPEHAESAIAQAAEFAKSHGAKVRFVTVLQPIQPAIAAYLPADARQGAIDDKRKALEEAAAKSGLGDKVSCAVLEGSVYHEILREADAQGVDLIVMGSHRPEMSTYLFGSNAAHVVRHAPCSVMVLR